MNLMQDVDVVFIIDDASVGDCKGVHYFLLCITASGYFKAAPGTLPE